MLKYYDVECKDCGNGYEVFIGDDEEIPNCTKCNSDMVSRVFSTFNFRLKYNNKTDMVGWSDNNYEASQYYRKINEARARGENVKAPDE